MLSIYACTLLICAASLAVGRAILVALGRPRPAWLSGVTGFAALVVAAPLLIRLPGRATTAAILIGLAVIAAVAVALRDLRRTGEAPGWQVAVGAVAIVLAAATLPFLISDRVGVLGEGVYTNDHAAQLYWADWLQHGFGPEPSAVRFGYPIGPQAVAVIAAQVTGASLVSAFNGLLLAIPVLTALTALAGLERMPAGRRIAIAALAGLPYLAASFLAQSAFKETAMALFVLGFALALASRGGTEADPGPPPWRSIVGIGLLLAAASVFTFSAPGLAWFVIAMPLWLVLEALAGRSPVDWAAVRDGLLAHKVTLAVAVLILIAIAAVAFTPSREFASKIADVQASAGRLSSPVFPGEALGIWPAGDFRIVRGEVSGSLIAVAIGALAIAYGTWTLIRTRQSALLAMLITGGIVYLGTRAFAEIHVQAKALAVIAPLVLLLSLRALLNRRAANGEQRSSAMPPAPSSPSSRPFPRCWRFATPRSASTIASWRSSGLPSAPRASRSPSSASTASPATTCARPSPAPRPATSPRRSTRAPRRPGSRGSPPTSTRSTPASSTSSSTRSRPPPASSRRRRRTSARSRSTATTCSGSVTVRRRAPRCSTRAATRAPSTSARPVGSAPARRWSCPSPRWPTTGTGTSRRRPRRGSPGRKAAGRRPARQGST